MTKYFKTLQEANDAMRKQIEAYQGTCTNIFLFKFLLFVPDYWHSFCRSNQSKETGTGCSEQPAGRNQFREVSYSAGFKNSGDIVRNSFLVECVLCLEDCAVDKALCSVGSVLCSEGPLPKGLLL